MLQEVVDSINPRFVNDEIAFCIRDKFLTKIVEALPENEIFEVQVSHTFALLLKVYVVFFDEFENGAHLMWEFDPTQQHAKWQIKAD